MFTEPQAASTTPATENGPPKKFMFERSFDNHAAARAPERKPVTLKPEQYDALKQESYDLGFAAGRQAGLDEQTAQLMEVVSTVGAKIEAMASTMQTIHKNSEDDMRRMTIAIARKIIPEFAARNGLQDIETMLAAVMTEMVHEPRLVVRVHESQFDVLNEKINALATQKAYAGKVVILADNEIALGDCRVEWADGGMERNTEALMGKIEAVVTP